MQCISPLALEYSTYFLVINTLIMKGVNLASITVLLTSDFLFTQRGLELQS